MDELETQLEACMDAMMEEPEDSEAKTDDSKRQAFKDRGFETPFGFHIYIYISNIYVCIYIHICFPKFGFI